MQPVATLALAKLLRWSCAESSFRATQDYDEPNPRHVARLSAVKSDRVRPRETVWLLRHIRVFQQFMQVTALLASFHFATYLMHVQHNIIHTPGISSAAYIFSIAPGPLTMIVILPDFCITLGLLVSCAPPRAPIAAPNPPTRARPTHMHPMG